MLKNKIIRFLKIYCIFWLLAIAISVVIMEILIGSLIVPERQEFAAEHGVASYTFEMLFGTTIFYTVFSFFGALIFYFKDYSYKRMGASFIDFRLHFRVYSSPTKHS